MASACLHLLELPEDRLAALVNDRAPPLVNVGSGQDLTIRELADRVRAIVGTDATVAWDASKPDGTPRKLLDVRRLNALGWRPSIALDDGIRRAYANYLATAGG